MNKRDFLKGGATTVAASCSATAALAAVRPSLGPQSGLASWKAHLGQGFEVDGHAVTLRAVSAVASRQPGEQFSLSFAGELPASLGEGIHTLTRGGGEGQLLYLARTPRGLRADFCRLQA